MAKKLKEFTCRIVIELTGNNNEAKSKEEYIEKVIEEFNESNEFIISEDDIYDVEELVA